MKRAVLYLRLSKEDEDKMKKGDDSESIVNQRLLLTDFALEKGFKIVDVYSDDDYSGLYDNRPEFDRLIKDSKLGKFDIILSKSQSRFTRNMEHMERYLHHDFPLLGIRFIGVVDGTDTEEKTNKKTRQINGLVNEWYCEDLSENIKAVFYQKMKAGQYIGAFAPYGYLKDPKDHHKFIIDEEAAKVVRWIYNLFLQGYSINGICDKLQEEQILSPTLYKKKLGLSYENVKAEQFSMKYNLWSPSTVKGILENETYIGKLIQGRYKKVSYKDKKVKPVQKENWIIVEQHHEPIISDKQFSKVQHLKKRRRREPMGQFGEKKVFLFSGKIRCEACGSTMIKSGKVKGENNDWYLRCQLANKTRLKQCTSHNIRTSLIELAVHNSIQEWVDSVLDSAIEQDEMFNFIVQYQNSIQIKQNKCNELKKLEEVKVQKMECIKLLYQDRSTENISEEIFYHLKKELEKEIEKLEKHKKQLKIEEDNRDTITEKEQMINMIKDRVKDFKLTHEIINDWVDYIEVCEKQKDSREQEIIIHWNL